MKKTQLVMSMMLVLTPLFSSSLSVIAEEGTSATEMTSETEITVSTAEAVSENKTKSSVATEKTSAQVETPAKEAVEEAVVSDPNESLKQIKGTNSQKTTVNNEGTLQSLPIKALQASTLLAATKVVSLEGVTYMEWAGKIIVPALSSLTYKLSDTGVSYPIPTPPKDVNYTLLTGSDNYPLPTNVGVFPINFTAAGIKKIRLDLGETTASLPDSSFISNAKLIVNPRKVRLSNSETSKSYDGLPINISPVASFGEGLDSDFQNMLNNDYDVTLQPGEYDISGGPSNFTSPGTYTIAINDAGKAKIKATYPDFEYPTAAESWGTFQYTITATPIDKVDIVSIDKVYDGHPIYNAVALINGVKRTLSKGEYVINPIVNADNDLTGVGEHTVSFTELGKNKIKAEHPEYTFENTIWNNGTYIIRAGAVAPLDPNDLSLSNPDDPFNSSTGEVGDVSLDVVPNSFNFGSHQVNPVGSTIQSSTQGTQYLQVSNQANIRGWSLRARQVGDFQSTDGKVLKDAKITLPTMEVQNSGVPTPMVLTKIQPIELNQSETTIYGSETAFYYTTVFSWQGDQVSLQTQPNTESVGDYSTTIQWSVVASPSN